MPPWPPLEQISFFFQWLKSAELLFEVFGKKTEREVFEKLIGRPVESKKTLFASLTINNLERKEEISTSWGEDWSVQLQTEIHSGHKWIESWKINRKRWEEKKREEHIFVTFSKEHSCRVGLRPYFGIEKEKIDENSKDPRFTLCPFKSQLFTLHSWSQLDQKWKTIVLLTTCNANHAGTNLQI